MFVVKLLSLFPLFLYAIGLKPPLVKYKDRSLRLSDLLCSSRCVQVDRVDRTPPTLTARRSPSTVADLGGGRQGIVITNKHLQASDPDSPTEELEFSISRPPHFGYLENALTGGWAAPVQYKRGSLN